MITTYCQGGTGCYANFCNCGWASQTGGTDTTFAPKMTIRVGSQTYASTTPRVPPLTIKEALKAEMRRHCRELTLAAQEDLAWLHHHEVVPDGYPRLVHYKRPGRRRTCTAVRNFRGRP